MTWNSSCDWSAAAKCVVFSHTWRQQQPYPLTSVSTCCHAGISTWCSIDKQNISWLDDHFFSALYFGKRVDSEYHWLDSCFLTLLSWLCLKTARQQDTFYFERDVIYYRTCTGSSYLVRSALLCLSAASRKDPKILAYTSISISTTFVTSCPQWLVAVNSFSLRLGPN